MTLCGGVWIFLLLNLGSQLLVKADQSKKNNYLSIFERQLSGDDDDGEEGWAALGMGERVGIVIISVICVILCLFFWYYIRCRKESSDRVPLAPLSTQSRPVV